MKIVNKLTMKLDEWWSRVTGRKHQYFVTLGYRPKGSEAAAQWTVTHKFWMDKRNGETFYREIRKFYGPDFIKQLPKHHLRNGKIMIVAINYLGRF
ncbi:MAG: hypothetical protein ACRCXB_15275 [Aeromonadaceae bacterium]